MVMSTTFWNKETGNELDIVEFPNSVCFSIGGVDVELGAGDVWDMISLLSNWLNS